MASYQAEVQKLTAEINSIYVNIEQNFSLSKVQIANLKKEANILVA